MPAMTRHKSANLKAGETPWILSEVGSCSEVKGKCLEEANAIGWSENMIWAFFFSETISFMNSQILKREKTWYHSSHWGRSCWAVFKFQKMTKVAWRVSSGFGVRSLWIFHVTNPNRGIGSLQGLLWEPLLQTRAAASKLTGKAVNG